MIKDKGGTSMGMIMNHENYVLPQIQEGQWKRLLEDPSAFEKAGTPYLRYNLTLDEPGNPTRSTMNWDYEE